MKKYDLAVLGGGFAGVAAALAAARAGAKVIILDKSNCLGGTACNALVSIFMPNSTRKDGKPLELSAGIFQEIIQQLNARNAMYNITFQEETLKYILNEMVLEAGIDLLFRVYLSKVNKFDDRIQSVSVVGISGEMEIEADYFLDATGDAQLSFLAGCPTVLGREGDHLCQPMTMCFRLGNVDTDRFEKSLPELQKTYAAALAAGEITNPRENILWATLPSGVLHFNSTRVVKKNPTDPFEVTQAEIIARRQVFELYDFMKKHADGLENSFLMMTASETGVRESRMIVGDYVLTEQDCKNCVKFEDAIAACNYPIDIHNPEGTGTTIYTFPAGEYFTIPYRCLIPQGADNMLVAGRCISSDHTAQASYRIMPVVCCIGEAAGTAIALALKNQLAVRDINTRELQALLKKNGAFLGI